MVAAAQQGDALVPFVFEGAGVRGALVRLPAAAATIVAAHPYPPALAQALSELAAASVLLASTLKLDGSLLLQIAGEGPVRLAVVECTGALDVRATAQWDDARARSLGDATSLVALAGSGKGRMTITLDPRDTGAMYQGIVALGADTVGGLIEHYLATSEQLQSRLLLSGGGGRAAGLLLQRLPSSGADDDAAWTRITGALDALTPAEIDAPLDSLAAIARWFPDDDLRVFDARAVRAHCSCSRARVENALRIAGRDEVEAAIAERGDVEVTCEFCGKRYGFTPSEARTALAPPDSGAIH
ncbi:MAG: Hsp33 family molecular chaperone HslO [Betaproteobacteria bacterium]